MLLSVFMFLCPLVCVQMIAKILQKNKKTRITNNFDDKWVDFSNLYLKKPKEVRKTRCI